MGGQTTTCRLPQSTGHSAWLLQPLTAMQSQCSRRSKHLQVLFCHQGRSKLSSKRQQDTWRATAMSSKIAFDEEEQRIRERTEARQRAQQAQAEAKGVAAPMKIKENYVPRAAARAANKQNMVLCPNCRTQMPANELEEHMRIELLDPRWKEQKAKADSRYATTNLSTQDVANNLKRLASQRSDLFDGVTGQPIISEEELARRKKAATSYDGVAP